MRASIPMGSFCDSTSMAVPGDDGNIVGCAGVAPPPPARLVRRLVSEPYDGDKRWSLRSSNLRVAVTSAEVAGRYVPGGKIEGEAALGQLCRDDAAAFQDELGFGAHD